jgi:hypothetical protein
MPTSIYTLAPVARPDGRLVREQRLPHERGALQQFAVIRMANLSLEHGHCDASMPPNWRLLGPQDA